MIHKCSGNEGQECWRCHVQLTCLDDYIGGGSRYWSLACPRCGQTYSYDTYGFRLYRTATVMLVAPGSLSLQYDADQYRGYLEDKGG